MVKISFSKKKNTVVDAFVSSKLLDLSVLGIYILSPRNGRGIFCNNLFIHVFNSITA